LTLLNAVIEGGIRVEGVSLVVVQSAPCGIIEVMDLGFWGGGQLW